MRTITTTIEAFTFEELSEEARQHAIEKLYDLNVSFDWWQFIYEDAENAGIKINGFDIDRGSYCEIKFIESAEYSAQYIVSNHGEKCDTFECASAYLKDRDRTIEGDFEDLYELDYLLDYLDDAFMKLLSECYLQLLRQEYEYLTSEEAIIETIKANEYEFTKEGNLV